LKVIWAVLFVMSFSVLLGSQESFAATVTIFDVPSCVAAGGTHTPARNQCSFFGSLTIPEGDIWNISNLRFGVANLIQEGEVNAQNEMDVDFMTNRGDITVAEQLISIGGGNFWINDCSATINLLPNTIFTFDSAGTNHGTINGDATTTITTPLAANTLDNSGTVDPNIVLNKVALQIVSSPCPPPEPEPGIHEDIFTEVQNIEEKLDGDRPSLITQIVDTLTSIVTDIGSILGILQDEDSGLEAIKSDTEMLKDQVTRLEEKIDSLLASETDEDEDD